jgi:hypothetical protein
VEEPGRPADTARPSPEMHIPTKIRRSDRGDWRIEAHCPSRHARCPCRPRRARSRVRSQVGVSAPGVPKWAA